MYFNFSIDVERDLHSNNYKGITQGLLKIKKLLDKHKIKPTLFVTYDSLKKYPSIFKKLQKEGWEIASHGYNHERFDEINKKEKEEKIKEIIKLFKKNKIKLSGFRAPQHSIGNETLDLLDKYKFKYDSSYTPLNIFQLFFFPNKLMLGVKSFFSRSKPYKIRKNLIEIPTSSFIIPFVSLSVRIFPITCIKTLIFLLNIMNKDIILFYCHSWDFIELEKNKIYKICPLDKFMRKLDKTLTYVNKKPITLKQYIST